MQVITRFAPSPSGYLHLGNIRIAFFNALLAYHEQGKFLLRMEDTDTKRSRRDFLTHIQADLEWLGLIKKDSAEQIAFQSQRYTLYEDYYEILKARGTAYPCFCTPQRLAALREKQRHNHQPPGYDGHCLRLSIDEIKKRYKQGEKSHLRFNIPLNEVIAFHDLVKGNQQFESKNLRDFVIRRSDGSPTFLYCNALDDALMGITHVLRGEDHLTNTAYQLLLLKALDLRAPFYGHLPLISHQSDTKPLSKRENSFSLQSLKQKGYLKEAILNYLARLGYTIDMDAVLSLKELAEVFYPAKIHQGFAHFDKVQLDFWQKKAISKQNATLFWNLLDPEKSSYVPTDKQQFFVEVMQAMVIFPSEAEVWAEILFKNLLHYDTEMKAVIQKVDLSFWSLLFKKLKVMPVLEEKIMIEQFKIVMQQFSKGHKRIYWQAIRAALTNRLEGPDIISLVRLLGTTEAVQRLQRAVMLSGKA